MSNLLISVLSVFSAYHAQDHSVTIKLNDPIPYHKHGWHSKLSENQQKERLIAMTIFGEGRSGGEAGMRVIASTIMNRVKMDKGKRWGHGIDGVVFHRLQYSCWNNDDPNRELLRNLAALKPGSPDYIAWTQAKGIAHIAFEGRLKDYAKGATYYHAVTIKPAWVKEMKLVMTEYGHSFYRNKNA